MQIISKKSTTFMQINTKL